LQDASKNGFEVQEMRLGTAPDASQEVMNYWLALPPQQRPQVVVCWNDTWAFDLLALCRLEKIRVPEDVALLSLTVVQLYMTVFGHLLRFVHRGHMPPRLRSSI
jgi:DNA-binding LacI/PurR family transcriptional regulator